MTQDGPRGRFVVADFTRRVEGADAAQVAAIVATTLAAIESSLRPVIGRGGVVAMYRRSLLIAGSSHPWLADGNRAHDQFDLAALRRVLGEHDAAEAARAGAVLIETLCGLLVSLIGQALSDRLLCDVWPDS